MVNKDAETSKNTSTRGGAQEGPEEGGRKNKPKGTRGGKGKGGPEPDYGHGTGNTAGRLEYELQGRPDQGPTGTGQEVTRQGGQEATSGETRDRKGAGYSRTPGKEDKPRRIARAAG